MTHLDLQGKKELISKLDATIAVLRRENQEKQNVISDLLSVRQAENETVESKIFSELQDTQRERRLATSQLAEQQDQSKRLNLDLRILDTLARNQGNQDD